MRILLLALALCLSLPASAQSPWTERRVALVVGVANYQHAPALSRPLDDAQRVHDALRTTGFEVQVVRDPTLDELQQSLRRFSRLSRRAEVSVLYFSGHGLQQFDDNWLIPADARLERPEDILAQGIRLMDIISLMGEPPRLRILFLDASRDSPFTARWPAMRAIEGGLAIPEEEDLPDGTAIMYSGGPRQVAPDNGCFANALAHRMLEIGVELRQVFSRVAADCPLARPTVVLSLNNREFFFTPVPSGPTSDQLIADRREAGRHIALVIGISQYSHAQPLANPRADADRIHESLRAVGFDAGDHPLYDLTKAQLEAALLQFGQRAQTADVAVLYFAGHGMQEGDDNWLIPSDARLESPIAIYAEGVGLMRTVQPLLDGANLTIVFLDACRDNPFRIRWPGTRTVGEGMADLRPPAGTVFAYSAGPGQRAADDGVFAQVLATQMRSEGVELRTMLDRVSREVRAASPRASLMPAIDYQESFYFTPSVSTQ